MPVEYGFYNSLNGDRTYDAEDMSSLFEGVFHDGVFEDIDDKLNIGIGFGMAVSVKAGRAWFNNKWIKNTEVFLLSLDAAHVAFGRVDAIVIEVDNSIAVRSASIKVIKGTPSSSPVAPTLTNSGDIHQYPLALITVGTGVTSILVENITNKVGTVDCPYVTGILRNVDTETVDGYIETLNSMIDILEAAILSSVPLTTNVSYYVAKTGNDSNAGTIGSPFLTINKALSLLPKEFKNADATIHIASGTYAEYLVLKGFYGYGNLYIYGANSPSKPITQSLNVLSCSLTSIVVSLIDPDGMNCSDSLRVTYDTIKCDNRTLNFNQSIGCYAMSCSFSGADPCIYANRGSEIIIGGNSGSGNGKVLESSYGSTIVKVGAVGITGTTAETVDLGGVIR